MKQRETSHSIWSVFYHNKRAEIKKKKNAGHNLRRMPHVEPGSKDLCFMLESLTAMKSQIDSLMDIEKQVYELFIKAVWFKRQC